MGKNQILLHAETLKEEIIQNRRAAHQLAEVGFDLPQTLRYVLQKLREYGYEPKIIGQAGIACTVGRGDKTILLRGDMDALPMKDETGLPFAADNGNCHACGHDAHIAMLLGAARLLKQDEASLAGRVKFMFQPAEEILAGANAMIADGILENPSVDAAIGMHISVGNDFAKTGVIYGRGGALTYSMDRFRITVKGVSCHGSTPYLGVDAVNIAAHIVVALQNIVTKELAMDDQGLVLVGKMEAGTAHNVVGDMAVLEGSTRAICDETRAFIKKRVAEIADGIAKTYGAAAITEWGRGVPPIINDTALFDQVASYCREMLGESGVEHLERFNGSEDFSMIAEKVPSVFLAMGAGSLQEGYQYSLHNPQMTLNEDVLHIGAAVYAQCAKRWLEEMVALPMYKSIYSPL